MIRPRRVYFSFEVPHNHLWEFHDEQDFIFALQQNTKVTRYARYLEEVHNEGLKRIWMDNGFNEIGAPCTPKDLFMTYDNFRSSRVVAPDSPNWDTEGIAFAFRLMLRYVPAENVIAVVRSKSMYEALLTDGAVHFAASYHSRREGFTDDEMMSIEGLHFLGLLDPFEVKRIRPLTCDTSMPIKLALRNQEMGEWMSKGCEHIHTRDLGLHGGDFFSATLTEEQLALAHENIKHLRRIVNG